MRKIAPIIIVLAIIAIPIVAMFAWMTSRPSWQISVRNSPQGAIVEVYKSNDVRPTYTTVLTGQLIDTEIERATRMELPAELGKTTFHDETLRPGRWRLMLDGTELDIMERALIVDGTTEIALQD
ncbi:hypothetical protein Pla52nx_001741 [Stieleria varia]|uniref:Uncharacterized protein n=2 Tax=Stieleria varia TaxID=2528005 RepID=A0A5C6B125_9BACT|nr:hypothetical protein Pla52n_15680 [Stieleria varia]